MAAASGRYRFMKARRPKKGPERGSVKQISDTVLGRFRTVTYELRPPRDPELLSRMERARVAMERRQTTVAAALAREVWTLGRGDKFVGTWVGQMLAKYGERDEAAEVYRVCEGRGAGPWEAYWVLGRFLLVGAHLHERAVEFLQEAIRLEPRAIDAHLDLVRCLKAMGRAAEAQSQWEVAQRLDPDAVL
jgi:tetratricopeptide (TPR) repeat protein